MKNITLLCIGVLSILLSINSILGSVISYWEFENNVLDSVGDNDGTRYNFVNGYTTGIFGYGLKFDKDSEQCVSFGNDESLNFGSKDFTVEAWVNITDTSPSDDEYIISKIDFDTYENWNGWYIKYNANKKFEIYVANGSVPTINYETVSIYNSSIWYNLTLQRIDNNFLFYVNDTLVMNETEDIEDINNTIDLLVGCRYTVGSGYEKFLKSVVDNIKIIYDYIPPITTTTIPTTTTTLISGTPLRYCIDENNLYVEEQFVKVKNGVETSYKFNRTIPCQYGCSNQTFFQANCNQSEEIDIVLYILIGLGIILLVIGTYKFISKM